MTVLLAEMTREQIKRLAPNAIAVLPTASIEQHGPHAPVITDTLLCGTVAQRAAEQAATRAQVVVAPVLCYGNSHHHRPFAGVLSLTSKTYMTAVTEILEGLVLSGFRKLIVLNGHGGNTDSNNVVGLDFVNGLGHDVAIATGAYWDIARPALVEKGLMPSNRIPGHAGRFETSMVMALRPELIDSEGMAQVQDQSKVTKGLFGDLTGATVQIHGTWAAGAGYTDNPAESSAEEGNALLEVVVGRVADFYVTFDQTT
ncbi:MAG: creatininase family protein [Caldilineaceae bacterium]|nr:creatininase family protein [Caldilineaceae bacterium]MCB0188919.1 creatininase family protein [Caldilineaceae bacterium]